MMNEDANCRRPALSKRPLNVEGSAQYEALAPIAVSLTATAHALSPWPVQDLSGVAAKIHKCLYPHKDENLHPEETPFPFDSVHSTQYQPLLTKFYWYRCYCMTVVNETHKVRPLYTHSSTNLFASIKATTATRNSLPSCAGVMLFCCLNR